jgi:hypothetical protein
VQRGAKVFHSSRAPKGPTAPTMSSILQFSPRSPRHLVDPKRRHELQRINHVPDALADLGAVLGPPPVREQPLRRLQGGSVLGGVVKLCRERRPGKEYLEAGRQEERGPVNGVKP